MTYVETIEPRLTPYRPGSPTDAAAVLVEWCRDLEQELAARLELVTGEDLRWQPHPNSNSAGVTVWHVARWIDVLGTRAFTARPASEDLWHTRGWRDTTGYEPDGIGYQGLGTLTGYTPDQMRAVPMLDASSLSTYLSQSTAALIDQITDLSSGVLTASGPAQPAPFQAIGATLQGSFGHVGEIDSLVALRARLAGAEIDRS